MSRIHEALKKAELDRSEGLNVPPVEAARPATAAEPSAPPPPPLLERTISAPGEAAFETLTLDLVRQRCPIGNWQPDAKAVQFTGPVGHNHSSGSEEFRTLRSRLYHLREKQPLQSLLVTSALPGEGKTFVTLNLARAFAHQTHRSVLMIDADLRVSRLHRGLGASPAPGLSDYLKGDAEALDVIQRGPQDNLFAIAGGSATANPVELLGTGRLRTLLHRLAPVFDWIILDSPPALFLSDSALLGKVVDGVVMVVQSGLTPFDSAQKACKEFPAEQLVGVVLNRVPAGLGYGHYYYYGYYDGSGRPNQLPAAANGS